MATRLGLFGGSFNPPGTHHLRIAEVLLGADLDQLIVLPCGFRRDKKYVASEHRKELVKRTFEGLSRTEISFLALEKGRLISNFEYEEIFGGRGELWHVVGSDLIAGGAKRQSLIQSRWQNGEFLFANSRFLIIRRAGISFSEIDCPPNSRIVKGVYSGSSSEIRMALTLGDHRYRKLVTPAVAEYIEAEGLYR